MPATRAAPARRKPAAGRPAALRLGFTLSPRMRVGLFGGSFNPAHAGHAHVAETARRRLRLNKVIWLVSPQNPLKTAGEMAGLSARMASARAVARGPAMVVSDAETRFTTRYTIDTVRRLKARFPRVRFVWLMGADSLGELHRWRGWTEILRALPCAVVARPGAALSSRFAPAARRFAHARAPARAASGLVAALAPRWVYLTGPLNFQSSTRLRRRGLSAASSAVRESDA